MIFADERAREIVKLLDAVKPFLDRAYEYSPSRDEFFCSFCKSKHARGMKDIQHLEACPTSLAHALYEKLDDLNRSAFKAALKET